MTVSALTSCLGVPVQIVFQEGALFRVLHTLSCDAWGGYGTFVASNVTLLGASASISPDKHALTIFPPYRYPAAVFNVSTNETGGLCVLPC